MIARLCERKLRPVALPDGLHNATRLALVEPATVFELDRREHQRKGREAFHDVVSNRLADLSLRARVIEYIVGDLERKAE